MEDVASMGSGSNKKFSTIRKFVYAVIVEFLVASFDVR